MVLDGHGAHQVLSSLQHVDLNAISLMLSDAATATADVAQSAAGAAVEAKKSGWWDAFVHVIESAIVSLHTQLVAMGVPGAYGVSIIAFTVAVKTLLFPLNFKQMESTLRMQALAPRLREIQADYKDNPQVMNQMTAQIYKDENINPLAGCLPVFAQIPIWIALYRSVLNLAGENLLNESFLWIPSLQGPVSKTGQGLSVWLYPLVDGAPPVGWHDALCYLILPVLLMATQFYSQKLMAPTTQDPQQQQANNFLKFMPLLIGWFSLNVPSGLGIYWVTNNVLSTAQTAFIKSRFPDVTSSSGAKDSDAGAAVIDDVPVRELDVVDGFQSNGTGKTEGKTAKAPKSSKKKRRKRR